MIICSVGKWNYVASSFHTLARSLAGNPTEHFKMKYLSYLAFISKLTDNCSPVGLCFYPIIPNNPDLHYASIWDPTGCQDSIYNKLKIISIGLAQRPGCIHS